MRARGKIVTVDEKQDEEDRRECGMGTRCGEAEKTRVLGEESGGRNQKRRKKT